MKELVCWVAIAASGVAQQEGVAPKPDAAAPKPLAAAPVAARAAVAGPSVEVAWVGPAPCEWEPWRFCVHAVGRTIAPPTGVFDFDQSVDTFWIEIERKTAQGFERVPGYSIDNVRTFGQARKGKELWWDAAFVDAKVVGVPGTYRLRMTWSGVEQVSDLRTKVVPVASAWIDLVVAPHAGNAAAVAADRVAWTALVYGWPQWPRPDFVAQKSEATCLAAIAFGKTKTLSPGLLQLGEIYAAYTLIAAASYRVDPTAEATLAVWRQARGDLAAIATRQWKGPVGGLSADVLRARIACERALGDEPAAAALAADLALIHPHASSTILAWPPPPNFVLR